MNNLRKLHTAAGFVAALSLVGCWGDSNNDSVSATAAPPVVPPVSTEVPDSAGVSTASFVSYNLGLSGNDEGSEPLSLKDTFAVPADESAEPTPLI